MIGGLTPHLPPHLGSRVSALLDGRLSAADEERAWAHVHECHPCRDLVEREGAIKTELACWSLRSAPAPGGLRESLLSCDAVALAAMTERAAESVRHDQSRMRNVVVMGGSALGMAFVGVLAFSATPANAPIQGPGPATSLTTPSPAVEIAGTGRGEAKPERRRMRPATTTLGGRPVQVSEVVVSGTMSQ